MSPEAWTTLAIVLAALAAMATTKLAPFLVLGGALIVCVLFGLVGPGEALEGFANPALATVGALFVVASGLGRSGILSWFAARVLGRGGSLDEARRRLVLPVAAASAFFNNTPIVAMLTPVLLDWSRKTGLPKQQLLIPLSYAAMLGGACTLLGTSTNLVVVGMLSERGLPGLSLFDITGVGLCVAGVGLSVLLTLGPRLLPGTSRGELVDAKPVRAKPVRAKPVLAAQALLAGGPVIPLAGVRSESLTRAALARSFGGGPQSSGEAPRHRTSASGDGEVFSPRAKLSLAIFGAMILAAASGLVSMLTAALLAALAMVMSRLVAERELLRAIDFGLLLAIGASFGLGKALEVTGAAGALAARILAAAGGDPWWSLVAIYLATLVISEIVTNNAAAVIVLPIALAAAASLGVSYLPFVIAVMVAASAAFATPIGYQTNMMVYTAGEYRFSDFLRIGLPMNLAVGTAALLVIPLLWPL